ncbi:hypothetical protein PMI27_004406 [Pseudomonas sp. GM41(2012)]|jgi:hypothetical protein|nr:hypothetical protein PMI27_004406 [Pseudomonas sp. GM41(2012)]
MKGDAGRHCGLAAKAVLVVQVKAVAATLYSSTTKIDRRH